MSDIVEAVAKAIWRQRVKFAAEADIDLSRDSEDDMIERNGVFEEASAAIEAYEAAKKKAEEPYVTRVEKGVTYWSNGLCSQHAPGSEEFAKETLQRACNQAYIRGGFLDRVGKP